MKKKSVLPVYKIPSHKSYTFNGMKKMNNKWRYS